MYSTDWVLPDWICSARDEWFHGKAYRLKKQVIDAYARFCQDPKATEPSTSEPPWLHRWVVQLWRDTLNGSLLTFDGLRKMAHLQHWMKGVLDERYARVFVDEAQDFDPLMLDILLNDVTVPKVFVGDPGQQIYEWRGTINAFEQLPDNTLVLEFYKTFRMGEPATSVISARTGVPMISGIPEQTTTVSFDVSCERFVNTPYTYLCRSWSTLLPTAQRIATSQRCPIWVHDFERQMNIIERLHQRVNTYGSRGMDCEQDEDLPAFLMKLTLEELTEMKTRIRSCSVATPEKAHCRFYTIHGFKGMEDKVVRVAGDVDAQREPNLYYVAVTRGMEEIWVDESKGEMNGRGDGCGTGVGTGVGVVDEDVHILTVPPSRSSASSCTTPCSSRTASCSSRTTSSTASSPTSSDLREALITFRTTIANQKSLPSYCIFNNKTLDALVDTCPITKSALRKVYGIGPKKVNDYGETIMGLCRELGGSTATPTSTPSSPSTGVPTPVQSPVPSPVQSPVQPSPPSPSSSQPPSKPSLPQPATSIPASASTSTSFSSSTIQPTILSYLTPSTSMTSTSTTPTRPYTWTPHPTKSSKRKVSVPKGTLTFREPHTPILLLCYDLETTGISPWYNDMTQLCVQFVGYRPWVHDETRFTVHHTYTTFVHTNQHLPRDVSELTGIHSSDLVHAPRFDAVYRDLQAQIDHWSTILHTTHNVWVAHNGFQFDGLILARYLARTHDGGQGLTTRENTEDPSGEGQRLFWCADTVVMARTQFKAKALKGSKSNPPSTLVQAPDNFKLQTLYTYFRNRASEGDSSASENGLTFHRADDDVTAMVAVLRGLDERWPGVVLEMVCRDGVFMDRVRGDSRITSPPLQTSLQTSL